MTAGMSRVKARALLVEGASRPAPCQWIGHQDINASGDALILDQAAQSGQLARGCHLEAAQPGAQQLCPDLRNTACRDAVGMLRAPPGR